MKQFKSRESERARDRQWAQGNVCHSTSYTAYSQLKNVPHPNLESSYIYQTIMTTWPFSCMNVGDCTIKYCWITVIIKYTHGSERYCPTVYMLLWKLLLQAMKTYNTFSTTCSALWPQLITIPTSILNVVKAELTFTGEGLFCISQCIIVGFLAPSSRSL